MTDTVKQHLPIIVVVTLVGIATSYFLLSRVLAGISALDVDAFSTAVFLIPCIVMLVCSIVIVITSHAINRQLYLVVVGIALITGIASMIAANAWLLDPAISSALLANSPDGTVITPILNSPILVLRDIAAYVVIPTIGCILGAWLGSRLHPMSAETRGKGKKKSKR